MDSFVIFETKKQRFIVSIDTKRELLDDHMHFEHHHQYLDIYREEIKDITLLNEKSTITNQELQIFEQIRNWWKLPAKTADLFQNK